VTITVDRAQPAATAPPPAVRVVPDLLRRSAHLVPDRPALVLDGEPRLTFAELESRSNACARGLRERHVRRGDRVALVFSGADWADYLVAYFGVLKLGAVALLVGDRFTADDVAHLVAGNRVSGVVAGSPAVPPVECWTTDVAALVADQSTDPEPIDVRPQDPAEVLFTSGTTARPRGVVATHANVVRAQPTWPTGVRANQPCAHALPVGSVAAQIILVNCVGGQHTLLIQSQFTPAGFSRLAGGYGAASVCLVPAMGHFLTRADPAEVQPMPSVRGVSFSGAALPASILPDLPRLFPHAGIYNFYTSTEAYPARVATRVDPARPESVGRPVGATTVQITVDGAVVGPGEIGEVWLRATDAPARQALDSSDTGPGASTVRDGWTRTGDLGYLDADGYLYISGRIADFVIVGGFNVSTARVEHVLAAHETVAEAAACGVDHPVLGEIVAAFVVLRADATVRELRQHAAAQLSRPELPAIIRIVDELPRNAAGKVTKRELPRLLDAPGAAEFVAARTDAERAIAAIWAQVLDLGAVGMADNFFEIGGDSLAANEIAARMRELLHLDVDAVAVFEAPTVADLAASVAPAE
jgi:long-chain acyl-CoA synthetase